MFLYNLCKGRSLLDADLNLCEYVSVDFPVWYSEIRSCLPCPRSANMLTLEDVV